MIFGKKELEEAHARNKKLSEQLEWHERHYQKQQEYIEDLYDLIGDMSRQLGMVLNEVNYDRIRKHPNVDDCSNFFQDISQLFNTRIKKNRNVTCYFGKDLVEIRKKFEDRDFRDSSLIHLTERFSLYDLKRFIRELAWKKPLREGLEDIRRERNLDQV